MFTRTPCTAIKSPSTTDPFFYTIETPRGKIKTCHLVHATNAWVSNLLPNMRRRIVPIRGNMTAQRPGQGLGISSVDSSAFPSTENWTGKRAFVYHGDSNARYDYLTQQPPRLGEVPTSFGELMFGGAFIQGGLTDETLLQVLGSSDDSQSDMKVAKYLTGSISFYFGDAWGREGLPEDTFGLDREWGQGRCISQWSGEFNSCLVSSMIGGDIALRNYWSLGRLPSLGRKTFPSNNRTPIPSHFSRPNNC